MRVDKGAQLHWFESQNLLDCGYCSACGADTRVCRAETRLPRKSPAQAARLGAPFLRCRRRGTSGFRRIVLAEPIRMHVGGDVEHSNVRIAQFLERSISRPDIRALHHRTTSAVDDDIGILRNASQAFLQHLDSLGLRTRPGVDRMQDVFSLLPA